MNLNIYSVGSFYWRIINYGIIAAFKYVLFEKLFINLSKVKFEKDKWVEVSPSKYLNIEEQIFLKTFEFVIQYQEYTKLIDRNYSKTNHNRLMIIGLALIKLRPDLFIETGTQYGISANFAVQFCEFNNIDCKVISFDVVAHELIKSNFSFTRIILKRPSRKNMRKLFVKFNKEYKNIIFFHDSDHSYENMFSDFNQAYKLLKPKLIISDDINLNNSFSDFCKSLQLSYLRFDVFQGNSVGALITKASDPDGT